MAQLENIKAAGLQKSVEALSGNPDAVRATFHADDYKRAYGTYLLGKISHICFPDAVPAPLSFGKDAHSGKYYMDISRAPLDAVHLRAQVQRNSKDMSSAERALFNSEHNDHELKYYGRKRDSLEPVFTEVFRAFRDAGIPFDSNRLNWTVAEGNLYHLDREAPWYSMPTAGTREFKLDPLREKIATLPDAQREEATKLLNELVALEDKEI